MAASPLRAARMRQVRPFISRARPRSAPALSSAFTTAVPQLYRTEEAVQWNGSTGFW